MEQESLLPAEPQVPPRRLSTDRDSPHFDECFRRVGVRLDGRDRKGDVIEYDQDAGWIEVYLRNAFGRILRWNDGTPKTKTMHGTVEPYFKENPPPAAPPVPRPASVNSAEHISAADDKRARKAAKRAALLAEGKL